MRNGNSVKTEKEYSVLGYYQIIGGIVGFIIAAVSFVQTEGFNSLILGFLFLTAALFLFSIYCGVLCLKFKKQGLSLSLINQTLQVIGFAVGGYSFQYVAGLYFVIGVDMTDSVSFDFGVGLSKLDFSINHDHQKAIILINVVACIIANRIMNLQEHVKEEGDADL